MQRHDARRRPIRWPALLVAGVLLVLPSCDWDGNINLLSWTAQPNHNVSVLGYSTCANYDTNIHTVRVPIFRNKTPWAVVPNPGLEMDLTKAVVKEIQEKTPYRVVSGCDPADTEILGTITIFSKVNLSYNQLNEVRESETTLVVALVWRDLRTGEILSRPVRRMGEPRPGELLPPDLILNPGQLPEQIPGQTPGQTPGMRTPLVIGATPTLPTEATVVNPLVDAPIGPPPLPGGPLGGKEHPTADELLADPRTPVAIIRSVAHFRPELGESLTTAQQKNINRMAVQIVSMMEKPW
jgi:hypothetical protein